MIHEIVFLPISMCVSISISFIFFSSSFFCGFRCFFSGYGYSRLLFGIFLLFLSDSRFIFVGSSILLVVEHRFPFELFAIYTSENGHFFLFQSQTKSTTYTKRLLEKKSLKSFVGFCCCHCWCYAAAAATAVVHGGFHFRIIPLSFLFMHKSCNGDFPSKKYE